MELEGFVFLPMLVELGSELFSQLDISIKIEARLSMPNEVKHGFYIF